MLAGSILALALLMQDPSSSGDITAHAPVESYELVATYPHDPGAFTQGLFFRDGYLFESTGRYPSTIRKVRIEDGAVLHMTELPCHCFGEGITPWGENLISLTWRNGGGFIWNIDDLTPHTVFEYEGEGWGLTHDGRRLIMSDGSSVLRFLDPVSLTQIGRLQVMDGAVPVPLLNELEWVDGEIFANVWQSTRIARIDPETGMVKAWIEMENLVPESVREPDDEVLNGIAWDPQNGRLFVTGKHWPKVYEVRVVQVGTR